MEFTLLGLVRADGSGTSAEHYARVGCGSQYQGRRSKSIQVDKNKLIKHETQLGH